MENKVQKKGKILDILAGEVESDSPSIDHSALGRLVKQNAPQFSPTTLTLVLPPLVLASGILLLSVIKGDQISPPNAQIILLSMIGLIFIWFVGCHFKRSAQVQAYALNLEKAVEELEKLKDYLRRYMQSMDQRTSKYFHAVTNTKVTTYFILMQLGYSIEEKLNELRQLLSRPTVRGVLAAFYKLQGNIVFHDGAVINTGQTHIMPLARLSQVIPDLIGNLEEGLKELESEISATRSNYDITPEE